ncbi:secretory immunoglobulin A-binding protein EsiB-like [Ornithodoros turicata]|uniref:secretory immunoglobulin A-binding protein EsiB-like n=1 Tax=Ornithodoros turicata TaxID=34597 RepID=UPI003139F79A
MTARRRGKHLKSYAPKSDNESTLPFRGKVQLARRRKPDSWLLIAGEVIAVMTVAALIYIGYYHHEPLHFHLNHLYARMGHVHAQHVVGHKYLKGTGVSKNSTMAFYWFRKAADQGHPHSAYNLAVGHMQGFSTDVRKGEAKNLIKYAAEKGVQEAHQIYHEVCTTGNCDH